MYYNSHSRRTLEKQRNVCVVRAALHDTCAAAGAMADGRWLRAPCCTTINTTRVVYLRVSRERAVGEQRARAHAQQEDRQAISIYTYLHDYILHIYTHI